MDQELAAKIRYLKLSELINEWDQYIDEASKGDLSHDQMLRYFIEQAFIKKQGRAHQARLNRAHIPDKWVMETFPFSEQPKLRKDKVLAVYDSYKYMTERQGIIWIGSPGVGKSGLATAFLMQVIARGGSGRFVVFTDLLEELNQSVADHSSKKTLKTYASYDCLLIDEIGYVEAGADQVGLFFRLMQARHKRKTTLITTNLGFSEWGTFLKNDHLTAALIDRITENCHVFNMKGCKSLRPKEIKNERLEQGQSHDE